MSEQIGVDSHAELRRTERVLRAIHEIAITPAANVADELRALLELGCREFCMATGLVTSANGDELLILEIVGPPGGFQAGDSCHVKQSYCGETLARDRPLGIVHAGESEWAEHPAYEAIKAESYIGMPIRVGGELSGTVCFLDAEPRLEPLSTADFDILHLIAQRVEALLDLREVERRLRLVFEHTAAVAAEQFFPTLVKQLAQAMDVRHAFVAECTDETRSRVRTLAFWCDGAFAANVEYGTEGTPCKGVLENRICAIDSKVRERFPDDRDLFALEAESYLGVPILDDQGVVIGLVAAIDDKPMKRRWFQDWLLKILAARAGAELVRLKTATALRESEERLRHAQKLESLGVLAGGVAHDFNNLLTGILGNASLALSRLEPSSPVRGKLEQIETATVRAADLTKQLLAYAGKGRFVVAPLDLNDVATEMTGLLNAAVTKTSTIRRELAPELPAIEADVTQIRQLLMNLMTNASDALEDGPGVIRLATGVVAESELDSVHPMPPAEPAADGWVYLEVEDTGSGMDAETQAKMFDPFFTTRFAGRGLGLSAVLGIVQGHGGAVNVRSVQGDGTTVRVYFPAVMRPVEAANRHDPVTTVARRSGTILIVDDEAGVREVARAMLEDRGFTVLTADDGRAGLEVFRERSGEIQAVLLDMTMPEMDGATAFGELQRIRADVPVVLSSGFNEREVTQRFVDRGLAGFIQKPYRADELVAVLCQAIDRD